MALLLMPYTNLHELNLDWIINNLKEAGVTSVNGETGIVVLYKEAEVQLPDIPADLNWKIVRKTNGTIEGIKFNKAAPMQRVHGNNEFMVYDAGNPPPYPVSSVNGSTGAVTVPVPLENLEGEIVSFTQDAPSHTWALNRKTRDGDLAISLDSTADNPTISLIFVNNNETVDETLKILTERDRGYVETTVPVNTAAGSYKVGTFATLGIPTNAVITSVLCINCTTSICIPSGISVSGNDIYVYLADEVQVSDGQIRITYMIP